ncbi:MAG: hypothetical protein FWF70_00700 [Bacteroidetes bacterium]|nr:hypothetical protein [Bacteroidota bacterium]MCL1969755.1 hypothetical protein [Bacteroidota bacterium]
MCFPIIIGLIYKYRPSGLAQAGLPLPLGRAQNFQICTNFQASYCPACAKPPVSGNAGEQQCDEIFEMKIE